MNTHGSGMVKTFILRRLTCANSLESRHFCFDLQQNFYRSSIANTIAIPLRKNVVAFRLWNLNHLQGVNPQASE